MRYIYSLYELKVSIIVSVVFFASLLPGLCQALPPIAAELPREYVDTTFALPSGGTRHTVSGGGDLQAIINAAQPGDIIELEAGAAFTGNFVLPKKATSVPAKWIYIISSRINDSSFPREHIRVTPNDAHLMARIVSPNTVSALRASFGAHHYRFVGIEVTTTISTTNVVHSNLILLGHQNGSPQTTQQLADNIVFDRCYIHGTPTGNVRRGIAPLARYFAVIDSYLSDFHTIGSDSQAVCSWVGPGPYKIVNNYLEGAAENVMFGGGGAPLPQELIPADIEVRQNYFYKPWSWKIGHQEYAGIPWTVKNLFELKTAKRVLFEGNILENVWVHAQHGTGVVITPREGVIEDLTVRNNVLRHAVVGMVFNPADVSLSRVNIENNLLYDIGHRLFELVAPGNKWTQDFKLAHNTALHSDSGNAFFVMGDVDAVGEHVQVLDNLVSHGNYGIFGSGKGVGLRSVQYFLIDYDFRRNALIGGNPRNYSEDTGFREFFFPANIAAVVFENPSLTDIRHFHLSDASPYRSGGTDGKDLGADIPAVYLATMCSISGDCSPDETPPAMPLNLRVRSQQR